MATRHGPGPLSKGTLLPAVVSAYQKLIDKPKVDESEFTARVANAKTQLFEKHASEQHDFWARSSQTQQGPSKGTLPPAVVTAYQKLIDKHKDQEKEFTARVADAKAQLFERHASEQHDFWATLPYTQPAPSPTPALAPAANNYGPQPTFGNLGNRHHLTYQNNGLTSNQHYAANANPPNLPSNSLQDGATNATQFPANRAVSNQETVSASDKRPPNAFGAPLVASKIPGVSTTETANAPIMAPKTATKAPPKPARKARPKPAAKAQSQRTAAPRTAEVIDLCSSEDESVPQLQPKEKATHGKPAATIQKGTSIAPVPSASLSYFGSGTASSNTVVPSQAIVKPEKCQDSDHDPTCFTSNILPLSPVSIQSGADSHTLPPIAAAARPLLPDPRTEFSHKTLVQQRNDRSSILREPTKLPKDPLLHSLQQQQKRGTFVNNILRNGRAQNWAPNLGKAFEPRQDVAMTDALTGEQQPTKDLRSEPALVPSATLPSTTQFKIPALPNRAPSCNLAPAATKSIQQERPITSFVSSETLPSSVAALNKRRSDRDPSATPTQTSITASQISPTRKRRQFNVSDDSNSDDGGSDEYAPSSDDDIPLSVLATKRAAAVRKKGKGSTSWGSSAKPPTKKKKKKNEPVTPKKPPTQATTPTTIHLKRTPSTPKKLQPPTSPQSPSARAASTHHSKRIPTTPTPIRQAPPSTQQRNATARRAKLQAKCRIDSLAQEAAQQHTSKDIRAADAIDHRLTSNNNNNNAHASTALPPPPSEEQELQTRLRSMSMTPAVEPRMRTGPTQRPATRCPAPVGGGGGAGATDERAASGVYTRAQWTRDRMGGDRCVARGLGGAGRGRGDEEDEGELDLGMWEVVDGRIYSRIEEVDLTER